MYKPHKACMTSPFKKTMLSSLIALSATAAYGQEGMEEELIVIGTFERNLNNAIDLKKNAEVVSDGISAADIGDLPALNMGEALQAVPGVQLNREGERRESSVNLRGLPSGFIKTTANGQGIAAPTRGSQSDLFGAPSPFGAYDPSIFNGINVLKTQEASMQEGGIAGTIDLLLPSALDKDNGGNVSLGFRNEELAGETDPEFAASGTYHIIDDVLAITGAIGYSEQHWRTDSVRAVRYSDLSDGNYSQGDTDYATLADWKAANNIPDNASVTYPGEVRQGSEINGGSRLSASANIEYQVTDELKLGASYIMTDRNMDDNRYEQIELRSREYTNIGVTPTHAPVDLGVENSDGAPVYMVPGVHLEDTRYFYDNRQYDFYQDSQAFIFDAEWTNDVWTIDGTLTLSDAKNTWDEILLSPRAESSSEADADFYTGSGNVENWLMNVTDFDNAINFDEWVWNAASRETQLTNSGAVPTDPSGNVLLTTGTYDEVENTLNSGEVNFERVFDTSSGITAVAFGFRKSVEEMDSSRVRIGSTDLDPTGIFTEAGKIPANANGDFFGGNIPGAADVTDGWYSFDFDSVNSALKDTIRDDLSTLEPRGYETAALTPSGYVIRANELGKGYDFTSELDITSLFLMADFEYGVMWGNAGLRYVDTDINTVAPTYEKEGSTVVARLEDANISSGYDNLLPSINLNFNLMEDLILRTAYNETFVRPNMRAASPESRVEFEESGDSVTATLPGTLLKPFEAQSFDVSLEWYNGKSGMISLAYYDKNIDNYFVRENICEPIDGYDFGDLTYDSAANTCTSGGTSELNPGANVDITAYVNSDATINVRGLELSLQQKFDFLPAPFDGFGGVFNYTKSDQDSDVAADEDPVEIYGISDNSYNLIAYYETSDWGVRFSYNWRSDYDILATNTLYGEGISTVKAPSRLDTSIYYHVTDDLTLRLKGYNLTENTYEEYQDIETQMRRSDFEGRTWVLSLGYKF